MVDYGAITVHSYAHVPGRISAMLNKNSLAIKKCKANQEATMVISDQKL